MIITEIGWIVKEVEKITSKAGKEFHSFQLSAKKTKKPKTEQESAYLYYSCYLHPCLENVAKFIRKGSLVVINGQLYNFNAYFNELRNQIIVKPEISVFSIQFVPKTNPTQSQKPSHFHQREPQAIEPPLLKPVPHRAQVEEPAPPQPKAEIVNIPEWKKNDPELPF